MRLLRQFTIVAKPSGGRNSYRDAPTTEVCDKCEVKLLVLLAPYMGTDQQIENLAVLRRDPPKDE